MALRINELVESYIGDKLINQKLDSLLENQSKLINDLLQVLEKYVDSYPISRTQHLCTINSVLRDRHYNFLDIHNPQYQNGDPGNPNNENAIRQSHINRSINYRSRRNGFNY